jgi:GTPase Era involved in 16S rRNA processing
MPKKIIAITQARGGAGKSTLTFMLAEKYQHAIILDADDATTATSKQLAYRNPKQVSFLDPISKRIDRNAFNSLFESVSAASKDFYITDFGASIAEQLPKYFEASNPASVREMLDQAEIELQIICVVGGGNNFKSTMGYLNELVESVQSNFKIVAAHNKHFPMSEEQKETFEMYCNDNGLDFFTYDLVNDKGELALRTAENVLQNGRGLAGLSPFKAVYFKGCLESLPI